MGGGPPIVPTRRRWFQFGFETLFIVVTAFAIWLGLELRLVRARQAWLRDHPRWGLDATHFPSSVPRWRMLLRDTEVHWILMPNDSTEDDVARIHQLFPEAGSISLVSREGTYIVAKSIRYRLRRKRVRITNLQS